MLEREKLELTKLTGEFFGSRGSQGFEGESQRLGFFQKLLIDPLSFFLGDGLMLKRPGGKRCIQGKILGQLLS